MLDGSTTFQFQERHFSQDASANADIVYFFWVVDIGFTVVFAGEVFLRICAFECTFVTGIEARWNVLDLLLVVVSIIEMAAVRLGLELSYIRTLRLFRIFRTLRVVRTVPLFMKLRIMVNAIANSVLSLFWALGLLLFTMLLFSAVFVQGATQYISQRAEDALFQTNLEYLETFFSSLPMAVMTLYMSITGGVSWWDVEKVMLEIGVVYGLLFLVYVAVMFFALLNIVTGIFVNDAVEMAQLDRDVMMRFEQDKRRHVMKSLEGIFAQIDKGTGLVTLEDFSASLERPHIAALLSHLQLEISDAVSLFKALDVDGSEGLEMEEFVMGCLQIRGQAKTVDMVTLMRENKRLMKKLTKSSSRHEDSLNHINKQLELLLHVHTWERDHGCA